MKYTLSYVANTELCSYYCGRLWKAINEKIFSEQQWTCQQIITITTSQKLEFEEVYSKNTNQTPAVHSTSSKPPLQWTPP